MLRPASFGWCAKKKKTIAACCNFLFCIASETPLFGNQTWADCAFDTCSIKFATCVERGRTHGERRSVRNSTPRRGGSRKAADCTHHAFENESIKLTPKVIYNFSHFFPRVKLQFACCIWLMPAEIWRTFAYDQQRRLDGNRKGSTMCVNSGE